MSSAMAGMGIVQVWLTTEYDGVIEKVRLIMSCADYDDALEYIRANWRKHYVKRGEYERLLQPMRNGRWLSFVV